MDVKRVALHPFVPTEAVRYEVSHDGNTLGYVSRNNYSKHWIVTGISIAGIRSQYGAERTKRDAINSILRRNGLASIMPPFKQRVPYKSVWSARSMDLRERNDCSVIAMSAATPLTYDESHSILRDAGRKNGHGFHFIAWMEMIATKNPVNGIKFTKVFDYIYSRPADVFSKYNPNLISSGPTGNLSLGRFAMSNPQGNYIVVVKGHSLAVIDGVIHDCIGPRPRRRVLKIYKVEL